MEKWNIQCFIEPALPPRLNAGILAGLCETFPDDREYFSKQRGWHGSIPEFTLVAREGERLLGHIAVVERVVGVGNDSVKVGGVQNVFVMPEARGTGLSGELMREALAEMSARGYGCGLLFCLKALEKVYAPQGWRRVEGRKVTRRENDESRPLPDNNITMYFPLAIQSLPDGDIDLRGNDW